MNSKYSVGDQMFSDFMQPFQQASPIGYLDTQNLTKKDSLDNFENSEGYMDRNRGINPRHKKHVSQFSLQVYEGMKQLLPQIQEEIKKQLQNQYEMQCQNIKAFYQKEAERVIFEKQNYLRAFYEKQIEKVRVKANDHAQQRIKQTLKAWKDEYEDERVSRQQNKQVHQKLVISENKNLQLQKSNQQLSKQIEKLKIKLQIANQQKVHWVDQQRKYSDTIRQLTQKLTVEIGHNCKQYRQNQNQLKKQISKWKVTPNFEKKIKRKITESGVYQEDFFELNSRDFQEIQNFTSYQNHNLQLFNDTSNDKQNQVVNFRKKNQRGTSFSSVKKESQNKPLKTDGIPGQLPLKLKQRQISVDLNRQSSLHNDKKNEKITSKHASQHASQHASLHSTIQKQRKMDFLLYDSNAQESCYKLKQRRESSSNTNSANRFVSIQEAVKGQAQGESNVSQARPFWDAGKKKKLLQMIRQKL